MLERVLGQVSIRIASKQIFLRDWNDFCYKQCRDYINGKEFRKKNVWLFFPKIPLIYWMTLVYNVGPFSVKNNLLTYLITHVYTIGPSSVKKIPLIYWMTHVYTIGPFSVKNNLIYWMILIYTIGPSSVQKIPLIYWMTRIYHRSFHSQK